MAKQFSIAVVLLGKDMASGPVGRALDKIGRKTTATLTMVKGAGDLAGSALRTIGTLGIAAAGAGLAVGKLVDNYVQRADELTKLSRQLGFTVEQLQELRYAASLSGVEGLDRALEIFSRNIGQARAGLGQMNSLLAKVAPGVRQQILAAEDAGAAFDIMMAAIATVEDPTKKAALATAAFGRSGASMTRMVVDGVAGLKDLREEARRFGLIGSKDAKIAEEFADNMDRLKFAAMGVVNTIGSRLLPVLEPLIKRATAWVETNRALIATRITQFIERMGAALRKIGAWFEANGERLWDRFNAGMDYAISLVGYLADHFDQVALAVKVLAGTWIAGKLAGSLLSVIGLAKTLATTLGMGGAAAAGAGGVGPAAGGGAAAAGAGGKLLGMLPAAGLALAFTGEAGEAYKRQFAAAVAKAKVRDIMDKTQDWFRVAAPAHGGFGGMAAAMAAGTGGSVAVTVDFRNVPAGVEVSKPTTQGGVTATARVGRRLLGWEF